MTSLIANTLNADIDAITKKSQALLKKTASLQSNATLMSGDVIRNRGGINKTEKSIRSKGKEWNLLASATLKSWREDEKKLTRDSWNPAVAATEARLKQCRPPAGLQSQPDLDLSIAEARAGEIPPLTPDLEEKIARLTSRLQPITNSSQRVLETCEALRNG